MVLGQEQDSVGGGFDADQSFQGMLSNVNIWNQVLTAQQIKEMSKLCLLDEAADWKVFKWLDFLREADARLVKPSSCEPMGVGRSQLNTYRATYTGSAGMTILLFSCLLFQFLFK